MKARGVSGWCLLCICVLWVCLDVVSSAEEGVPRFLFDKKVSAGPKRRVYDPSTGSATKWYVNDHTFIYGPGGEWHLYGITHSEPADPLFEVNFAHAIAKGTLSTTDFAKMPFALGTISPPETHLWAPHVVEKDGLYHMFYCGGGDDRTNYLLRLAVSKDLWHWERVGTLFTGGIDGRDPMAMPLPPEMGGGWIIYYTATNPDSLTAPNVHHITLCRTSNDLVNWSDPVIAFDGGPDGNNFGGPTESPFVVRRGPHYYLLSGAWDFNYTATRVFYSKDPKNFGSVPLGTAVQVGAIDSHAPEVIRDTSGKWYVSSAGWGQGGVYLSELTWYDGCDSCDTNLPIPQRLPPQPPDFRTNLTAPWQVIQGQWMPTPSGMQGGSALGTTFLSSGSQEKGGGGGTLRCTYNITLTTTNGNPTSSPGQWTRVGSSALFAFRVSQRAYPDKGGYVVNITTAGGGGVSLYALPSNRVIAATSFNVEATVEYQVELVVDGANRMTVAINHQTVLQGTDTTYTGGWVVLGVDTGAANFQDVYCSTSK